ncbi:MAG: hypothetical protein QME12_02910 [Nanoarchaeota archaeon]|nr:hypothetical protein [Nanoarchaeota archaeon]
MAKRERGNFSIDTSMRPYLIETHYVGISDGETKYSVEVPARLKKKYFQIYGKASVPGFTEKVHCVAIALCINAISPKAIVSIRICTDISKRAMHNNLILFLRAELYSKVSGEKADRNSPAHHYVTRIRKGKEYPLQ